MIRVALVGLGLIGSARLHAIEILRRRGRAIGVETCYDPHSASLGELLKAKDIDIAASFDDVIARRPDLAVVAVPHDVGVEVTRTLLSSGIKVLLEKPLGRSLKEAQAIVACAKGHDQLWIGHNFRFFAGVTALLDDLQAGRFGHPVGMSILMGHGGSSNDRMSWKLDKQRAGGGALIDPGIHLIDLCRIAGGCLSITGGVRWQGFWNTGIEEECRLTMSGARMPLIDLTVSIVRWRSTFRIEIFGTEGYGIVQGRGRSYGAQTYRRGVRWGWQAGPSQEETEETVVVTSGEETFADELESLLFGTAHGGTATPCNADEAIENMKILESIRDKLELQ